MVLLKSLSWMVVVSSLACSRVNACRWCISMLDILMSCSLMYLVLESPMIMIFLSGLDAAVMVLSLLFSSSLYFLVLHLVSVAVLFPFVVFHCSRGVLHFVMLEFLLPVCFGVRLGSGCLSVCP